MEKQEITIYIEREQKRFFFPDDSSSWMEERERMHSKVNEFNENIMNKRNRMLVML
jgi:hypothetical protein